MVQHTTYWCLVSFSFFTLINNVRKIFYSSSHVLRESSKLPVTRAGDVSGTVCMYDGGSAPCGTHPLITGIRVRVTVIMTYRSFPAPLVKLVGVVPNVIIFIIVRYSL